MITEADRYVLAGYVNAYVKKYQAATDLYSEGISLHPEDASLYRHRGHRYITLREFDKALADFQRAAELVEGKPDEIEFYQPENLQDIINLILNRQDRVTHQHQPVNEETVAATSHLYKSTLKSSIFYHWALSLYLQGEFAEALPIYQAALDVAVDNDMRVATSDWYYMALRRLGRVDEAQAVLDNLDSSAQKVVEPSYMRRVRLYKGELQPEDLLDPTNADQRSLATQGYGVGNWYLYSGDTAKARDVFERIIAAGSEDAFGYIAAEVELARLNN